jgi:hypothetical protein
MEFLRILDIHQGLKVRFLLEHQPRVIPEFTLPSTPLISPDSPLLRFGGANGDIMLSKRDIFTGYALVEEGDGMVSVQLQINPILLAE